MLKIALYGLASLMIAALFFPSGAFPDPSESFIDDNVSFDELFSDIPDDFSIDHVSHAELSSLSFFSSGDVDTIISYRNKLSAREKLSENLDKLEGLSPFQMSILVYLVQNAKPGKPLVAATSIRSGLEYRPDHDSFEGSKYYFKSHSVINKSVNVHMLGERDRNEPRALDFTSMNVSLKILDDRVSLLAGDFNPGYGQGLLFSRYGRFYGSGTNVFRKESNRVAGTLFNESRFLRGGHASIDVKHVKFALWASIRKLDASMNENGEAVTIKDSGYHFSGDDRSNLRENIAAARFGINNILGMKLGMTGSLTNYSPGLGSKDGERYWHHPDGKQFAHIAVDGRYERDGNIFFFEHAVMDSDDSATLAGLTVKQPSFSGSLITRHYDTGFRSPRAGAISSFGKVYNEEGVYAALDKKVSGKTGLYMSMDIARTLNRTYLSQTPVSRKRLNAGITTVIRPGLTGLFSVRSTGDSNDKSSRWNSRVRLAKRQRKTSGFAWKANFVWSENNYRGGPFISALARYGNAKFRGDISVNLFDIPSYDARYYHYETNVPGHGMTQPYWGKGSGVNLLFRIGPVSMRIVYTDSDLMQAVTQFTVQCDTAI